MFRTLIFAMLTAGTAGSVWAATEAVPPGSGTGTQAESAPADARAEDARDDERPDFYAIDVATRMLT